MRSVVVIDGLTTPHYS